MASGRSTVDTYVSRRRMERSERTALVAGALAIALGAAAWLTQVDLSAQANTADVVSFEDRFVPVSADESFHSNRILQPLLDRSALAKLEGKLRDAKGVLAQQLTSSDWRATLLGDRRPATTSVTETTSVAETALDIPLPRP